MTFPATPRYQATVRAVALLFALLAVGLGAMDYALYQVERRQETHHAYAHLQTVAAEKAARIGAWRTALVVQVQRIVQDPLIHEHLAPWLNGTAGHQDAVRLSETLRDSPITADFDEVLLTGADAEPLLSTGPLRHPAPGTRSAIDHARSSGHVVLSEAFGTTPETMTLDVVTPILARGAQPAAYLIGRKRLATPLGSIAQNWPLPSETASAHIVQQGTDETRILHATAHGHQDIQHQFSRLPAAQRATHTRIELGFHDGHRAFGLLSPVPDSNWVVVAHIEAHEALAGVGNKLTVLAAATLGLVLSAALGSLWFLARQRREEAAEQDAKDTIRARLSEAQAIGHLGSWERNLQSGETWWSRETFRIYGYPVGSIEPSLEHFFAPIHPDDAPLVRQAIDQSLATGESYQIEFRMQMPDGSLKYCQNRGTVIRGETGQPVLLRGTTQDITARKRAELELARERSFLVAILDNLPQGISVFDTQLRLKYWNRDFIDVLGLPREAVRYNVTFEDLIRIPAERGEYGPGDPEEHIRQRRELALKFEPHAFERSRPNGQTHLISGQPLLLGGTLAGFITTYTNITQRKASEQRLQRQHDILQTLLDNLPDGVSLVDGELRFVAFNERFKEILDLPDSLFEDPPTPFSDIALFNARRGEYGPGDPEQQARFVIARAQQFQAHHFERTRPGGTRVEIRGVPLPGGGFVSIYTDVTGQRLAAERLLLSDKVFENTPEAILITDAQNRIVSVNPAFSEITGFAAEEVLGRDPSLLASGRHDKAFYQAMWDSLRDTGKWSGEIWDRRKNGDIYPKWTTINVVRDDDGTLTHYIALFADISERKAQEAHIRRLAHHDALTGLANRFTLEARLGQAFSDAQRYGKKVAVVFIDLDRFKTINDSLGHPVGDAMLVEVARRLTKNIRESDTAARLGGDEFVLILPDIDHSGAIAAIAAKLIEAIAAPIEIQEHALHTSGSLGIAVYPDDGTTVSAVMKNADTAMYHAKSQGRNNFQFFAAAMNESATARLQLESNLRRALAEEQFELHYQPQVSLRDGRIIGVEALIRWQHPDGSLVPPDRFIPVAEESGLIQGIGDWVLGEACRQLRAWQDAGLPAVRMAINLSARQLRSRGLADFVRQTLAEYTLRATQIELEITESAIMERPEEAVALLGDLSRMGISLAIDDFGTGYSSLAYLKLFPIDRLKIDRSFVKDIETDPNDRAIALGTIALAHSLGLEVVAEGVETETQQRILQRQGCEEAQGFRFSRPRPAAQIAELLRRNPPLPEADAPPPG